MTDAWLERTAQEITSGLGGAVEEAIVTGFLRDAVANLQSRAVVDTFIPVLAARMARERTLALALAEGRVERSAPEVLFVCVHNAGRSQMAAVLTRELSGGRVNVRSAGSTPANEINASVAGAMAEEGMDLSQEFPKPLTDEAVRAADVVITMGCGDTCPIYPGKRYLDWEIPDPAGQPIEVVRWIRDDIKTHVRTLLQELDVEIAEPHAESRA